MAESYGKLALKINKDNRIRIVLIQHEFGFFKKQEQPFLQFLTDLTKPVIIVFHTVLPHPDKQLESKIKSIVAICESVIVMTHNSSQILIKDYGLSERKISVIAHGTHLVPHLNKNVFILIFRRNLESFNNLRTPSANCCELLKSKMIPVSSVNTSLA